MTARARTAALQFIPPCLAKLIEAPPAGDDWLHEIKFDGYRVQAHIAGGRVRLYTRNGLDWTEKFGTVVEEFAKLKVKAAIIDCEAVVLRKDGVSDFSALAQSLGEPGTDAVTCMAFDVMHRDGRDLTDESLVERKQHLAELLAKPSRKSRLRFSTHATGEGPRVLGEACGLGLEGIISKRADSPYRSGRTGLWTKSKCALADPFVVIGFTPATAPAHAVGALVLAYYDAGALVYAGRVGTGFTQAEARALWSGLSAIAVKRPHKLVASLTREQRAGVIWVAPRMVAQVRYRTWTGEGVLRHASFQHFRQDKRPGEVSRPASLARKPSM